MSNATFEIYLAWSDKSLWVSADTTILAALLAVSLSAQSDLSKVRKIFIDKMDHDMDQYIRAEIFKDHHAIAPDSIGWRGEGIFDARCDPQPAFSIKGHVHRFGFLPSTMPSSRHRQEVPSR